MRLRLRVLDCWVGAGTFGPACCRFGAGMDRVHAPPDNCGSPAPNPAPLWKAPVTPRATPTREHRAQHGPPEARALAKQLAQVLGGTSNFGPASGALGLAMPSWRLPILADYLAMPMQGSAATKSYIRFG
jgi:hypothetical protein